FGKRPRCLRRRSSTYGSISFSSRGCARIVTRESVTPEIADTTRNFRFGSVSTRCAIRSYMSTVLTQFPPNFATFHGPVKVASPVCELRVEQDPARAAANRVVREDEEADDAAHDTIPADGSRHSAQRPSCPGP